MAVGLFNLLISAKFNWLKKLRWGLKVDKLIEWLAGVSFGIYLIHTFVVSVLSKLGFDFDSLSINVYVYNVVNYSLVFGISLVITYLIKKNDKLKMIVGE